VRRTEALHPAPLLVDQDRRVVAPDRGPELRDQSPHLLRIDAVAAKKDQAPGIGIAQEGNLVGGQPGSGAADDQRVNGHRVS
jgi:hypothetical protein